MADLDGLLYDQSETIDSMSRLLINLKKVGKNNFTPSLLQGRLTNLNNIRSECKNLNRQIYIAISVEQRKSLAYFKNQEYHNAENIYYEVSDYISVALSACVPPINANSTMLGNSTFQDRPRGNNTPLPRIDIPKFSRACTDWISFRDMFQSLVINNEIIPNVQKLHYLKMGVSGEARSLLNTITISETNFQIAWNKLKDRYENSRHIIDSYLANLFDVTAVMTERFNDLKRLKDQTHEAISSLGKLNVPVDQLDAIVTFMTVRMLDPTSRHEWEMRMGEKSTYPTYKKIHTFLEYRMRALESIHTPSNKKPNKPKGDEKSTKAHLSPAPKLCECDETHPLYKCVTFRAKSVEQRQKIVREQHLCNICLASGHQPIQWRSKSVCYHCKQRHSTLLHSPTTQKKEKNEKGGRLSFYPAVTSNSSPPVQSSTPRQTAPQAHTESQASSSQHVVSNLHACETELAPATVMLATAWVSVLSSKGRTIRVRALLDQGSQSSFVTESIVQALRAPRTRVRAPVTGIGGTDAGIGRALVKLTLTSCIGTRNKPIQCSAIVFNKLTSYVPPRSQCLATWRHLEGLELADPEPSSRETIQLILGADIYANILCEAVKRGPKGSPVAQNTEFGWILSGPTTNSMSTNVTTITAHLAIENTSLVTELRRFWELEEVPTCSSLTEEEIACENHFAATHIRLPEGSYRVRLPFKKPSPIAIGSSRYTAESWLAKLNRKFVQNPDLIEPYYDFMNEYLILNHMPLQRLTKTTRQGLYTYHTILSLRTAARQN